MATLAVICILSVLGNIAFFWLAYSVLEACRLECARAEIQARKSSEHAQAAVEGLRHTLDVMDEFEEALTGKPFHNLDRDGGKYGRH
jgi:hypothetical protein